MAKALRRFVRQRSRNLGLKLVKTVSISLFGYILATALYNPANASTPPGVLVVGQIAEPKSLDPQADTAANDFRILVNVYDGLVRYKPGTLRGRAGAGQVLEDQQGRQATYTFHLRKGVKFHDGTPFNAEAVKFNFDRMLDKQNPYYDTGPFPLAFLFSSIEETEVTDADDRDSSRSSEPYAPLLSNLACPTGLIVSPAAVKKYGKDFGRHPVGTGPFKFDQVGDRTSR